MLRKRLQKSEHNFWHVKWKTSEKRCEIIRRQFRLLAYFYFIFYPIKTIAAELIFPYFSKKKFKIDISFGNL